MKNSKISAVAFHRFNSQPASGRSSALPCLVAFTVLSNFLWIMRLHSCFSRPFYQLLSKLNLVQKHYSIPTNVNRYRIVLLVLNKTMPLTQYDGY